ncbi:phage minor head protein [Rodentibacter caecimuris]|uniref:phage minor head protein n=1 Tax=Rodentibacter caecimuris TaxID=1796644 RepID=UPI00144101B9|nr:MULTISPECIES: phage minor head protein [Pasteurellaceae]MCQ9122762.1 minor capsid protein [Rodentibacter heylii]MCR1838529.1 phage minor head protein [Pasteurella caecimuris]MCU0107840.1 phage minor head protein [Pasteurella caecimuris]
MLMNLPEILKNQKRWKARKFKPVKSSKRTEIWYHQQLKVFVKNMTSNIERALQRPQSPFFMDSADGFQAISKQALLDYLKKYQEKDRTSEAEYIAQGFVSRGNIQNQREVSTNLKNQTGVDLAAYLNNSPNIKEKLEMTQLWNVSLISNLQADYLNKINNAVTQSVLSGGDIKDLAAQIKEIAKVSEKRAALIARDQTSKFNAALTQARHEDLGVKKYMWSTAGDERVRDNHAEKDGQIFEYANPPEDTGHPGHDINCRCVQIAVFDEVHEKQINEQLEKQDAGKAIAIEAFDFQAKEIAKDDVALSFVKNRNLSKPEAVILREYTGHSAQQINADLRSNKPSLKTLSFARILNRALNKLPSYKGKVWRDVDLPEKVLALYSVGEIVTEKGFVSSSRDEFERFDSARPHRLLIHSKNGKIIEKISILPLEYEVLFRSGTKFKVLKRTQKKEYLLIELQEL